MNSPLPVTVPDHRRNQTETLRRRVPGWKRDLTNRMKPCRSNLDEECILCAFGRHLSGGEQIGSGELVYRDVHFDELGTNWTSLATISMPPAGLYTNVDNARPTPGAYYRAAWVP